MLATIGPATLPTLLHAVHRSRRFKTGPPLSIDQLRDALTGIGATQDGHGRWHPPPQARAPQRFLALAAALGQQELTRQELAQVLIDVGYTASSANGRIVTNHPLIERAGRDRYRLLTQPTPLTRGHSPATGATADRCQGSVSDSDSPRDGSVHADD